MVIQRVDDNTIRCLVTKEDMDERGLTIDDFFENKDKAKMFLKDIVKQAHDEVGYSSDMEHMAMQVMPLPQNGLAITLSDRVDFNIGEMIGQIRSILEETGEMIGQAESESDNIEEDEDIQEDTNKKRVFYRVYQFDRLDSVSEFCKTVSEDITVKSQLFKDEINQSYYLIIEKGRLSMKKLEMICLLAPEYGKLVAKDEAFINHCREHFKCIIKKSAVKVARQCI